MKCDKCGEEIQRGKLIMVTTEDHCKYHFCDAQCAANWLSGVGVYEWPKNEEEAKRLDGLVRVREFD